MFSTPSPYIEIPYKQFIEITFRRIIYLFLNALQQNHVFKFDDVNQLFFIVIDNCVHCREFLQNCSLLRLFVLRQIIANF